MELAPEAASHQTPGWAGRAAERVAAELGAAESTAEPAALLDPESLGFRREHRAAEQPRAEAWVEWAEVVAKHQAVWAVRVAAASQAAASRAAVDPRRAIEVRRKVFALGGTEIEPT